MPNQILNGKLVCKYCWVCALRPENLYVYVMQTPRGNLIEFKKLCHGMKSLYESVDVGDEIQVEWDPEYLRTPDDTYSLAIREIYATWRMSWTNHSRTPFKVPARRSIKSWWMHDQPGHMIGHYVDHYENEEASRGSFTSYYVEFEDIHGTPFVCQFWCNEKLEDEFLPNVEYYDKILILNARILPEDRYENTPNFSYRLVTSYAPGQDLL